MLAVKQFDLKRNLLGLNARNLPIRTALYLLDGWKAQLSDDQRESLCRPPCFHATRWWTKLLPVFWQEINYHVGERCLRVLMVIISKVEYLKEITAYLKSTIELWFSKLHNKIFECQNWILKYGNWTFNFYGNQSAIEPFNFKTAHQNITVKYSNVKTAYLNFTIEYLKAKTVYLNVIIELSILMGITLHSLDKYTGLLHYCQILTLNTSL